MLHFGMNMPYYLMMLYGNVMIVIVLILRALFRDRLPKFVFPVLWGVVLLRFLIPFSVSSPLSILIPWNDVRPVAVTYFSSGDWMSAAVEGGPVFEFTADDSYSQTDGGSFRNSLFDDDLEAACDAAVLGRCGEEEKKDYAFSLLAMAVGGNRMSLLYSAFSKTEVEKRMKNILSYKKMTAIALLFTVLLMAAGMTAFASIGQAPFHSVLTAFCSGDHSRWGVDVTITRDIALGEDAQERVEDIVFSVLDTDETGDPEVIEERILTAGWGRVRPSRCGVKAIPNMTSAPEKMKEQGIIRTSPLSRARQLQYWNRNTIKESAYSYRIYNNLAKPPYQG